MDGRDVGPREHVGYHVVLSADMSHVGGKLADEGHVASLTGRTLDGAGEGEGEGLMVSEYGELVAFDMVAKVFYSEEDGQQLGSKALYFLSALESFLEKKATGHQMPLRSCSSCRLTLWGPHDCLPLYLGGIVEGVEFVGQPRHEAGAVVDHAEEALETDLIGGHGEVAHCLNPGLKGYDA